MCDGEIVIFLVFVIGEVFIFCVDVILLIDKVNVEIDIVEIIVFLIFI